MAYAKKKMAGRTGSADSMARRTAVAEGMKRFANGRRKGGVGGGAGLGKGTPANKRRAR
jgi:hypothetical protein